MSTSFNLRSVIVRVVPIILLSIVLLYSVVSVTPAVAASCRTVSGSQIYTDYFSDRAPLPAHRVVWIWSGGSQPIVRQIYYNNKFVTPSNNTIDYQLPSAQHQNGGWFGYNIDTTSTLFPWSTFWNWNDDWRWSAYICT